jgi:hypothetical protein
LRGSGFHYNPPAPENQLAEEFLEAEETEEAET